MYKKIKVPVITTPYRTVYVPGPDTYKGIDTPSFRYGERYDTWIANDFTIVKAYDGCWHAFGIIHPKPPAFTDDFNYSGDVHEAEYQLFHCVFEGTLEALYSGGSFTEKEKVLYPQSRPGEAPECWAPCIIEKDKTYYMYYTPETVRLVTTKDLYNFSPYGKGLFSGLYSLRDPYIFFENGNYIMIYVNGDLCCRSSADLIHWDEEKLFQKNPFGENSAQESPCLLKRHGMYYLIWCIHDGQNGCYDNRSFVFASESLDGFTGKAPVAMFKAHAPEIVSENGQDYIISVYYPENGLSIAKVSWE
mgnify:CR=1 FL=1